MTQKINPIKIFLLCPIPEEQKPIYEYITLKKYFSKFISFEINFFVGNKKKISIQKNKIEKNLNENIFISFFKNCLQNFLILINVILCSSLFIRWEELKKRFNESTLFYEEASWYDGQIWEKPFSIIKNDRLLKTQILEQIKIFSKEKRYFW
jgi:hypothetical protein